MAEDVHLQGPGQRWPSGGQGDGVHLGLGEGEGAGLFGAGEEGSTSGSHVFPRSRRSTPRSSPIPPQLAREASRASGALELAYLTPRGWGQPGTVKLNGWGSTRLPYLSAPYGLREQSWLLRDFMARESLGQRYNLWDQGSL